jgi:hypothetical protein
LDTEIPIVVVEEDPLIVVAREVPKHTLTKRKKSKSAPTASVVPQRFRNLPSSGLGMVVLLPSDCNLEDDFPPKELKMRQLKETPLCKECGQPVRVDKNSGLYLHLLGNHEFHPVVEGVCHCHGRRHRHHHSVAFKIAVD